MCTQDVPLSLSAASAFPAPCDNQQHSLTLSHRAAAALSRSRRGMEASPLSVWRWPRKLQSPCSVPAGANAAGEGDRVEPGGLGAAGPSAGSVANPHECCQSCCFDDESLICHEQLRSRLPALARPAAGPEERGGRSPSVTPGASTTMSLPVSPAVMDGT